ncbi:MogA/MoaB family molybdenum cofactor biosynthesis protein [Companilactobacillus mishanensis]|uniref:Molybdenum cofactor biosynthesis protein B n=1 Tax=Companilactobacillus mishanensis TaxID=2486008 RepID=A0A5P0ZIF6_9LACO|nr:molybdenum cofactor biosynthesis protein B [Companilactobacillus mishanensis]MQS45897.1 molybdenum cofactor biosynthesis protein MoaB [Companilactobacillus mishanensis]MQS52785.1 molybdenum cofactor biosynthesis protein MoaB [Companilactobacillus mishanensis]MQS89963.1 molybdenum cofactor biosynthesis protein MoaB [Companilactobacillus mishanensis]
MIEFGIITVSDTRTEETDKSGKYLQDKLTSLGNKFVTKYIVKDDAKEILMAYNKLIDTNCELILVNGGTGIAVRDVTIETLEPQFVKLIPGFGEYFRRISFDEIGTRALASGATAGITATDQLCYLLPGSTNACQTALEKVILPDLDHLIKEITK